MSEPEYIAQTGEKISEGELRDCVTKRVGEARAEGCTFFRASVEPDIGLTLVEGWIERPEDQGPIRWQLAPPAS